MSYFLKDKFIPVHVLIEKIVLEVCSLYNIQDWRIFNKSMIHQRNTKISEAKKVLAYSIYYFCEVNQRDVNRFFIMPISTPKIIKDHHRNISNERYRTVFEILSVKIEDFKQQYASS